MVDPGIVESEKTNLFTSATGRRDPRGKTECDLFVEV